MWWASATSLACYTDSTQSPLMEEQRQTVKRPQLPHSAYMPDGPDEKVRKEEKGKKNIDNLHNRKC